ncbi:hypothetical protein COOONC_13351 [Cooperia oncophora]
MFGVAWLTSLKWILARQVVIPLDESHEFCARIMGALFLGTYIAPSHALQWSNMRDRMVAVDARIIACLGIISAQLWSQSAYPDFWSRGHWIGITLSATWCLVSIAYRIALSYTIKIKTV